MQNVDTTQKGFASQHFVSAFNLDGLRMSPLGLKCLDVPLTISFTLLYTHRPQI